MPKREKAEKYIPIGRIVGAHGVHGGIRLLYFSHLKAFPYTELYLQEKGAYRRYKVTSSSPLKETLALRLDGVFTRTEAQALAGQLAYYPRERFNRTERDEYYWTDLIGMVVIEHSQSMPGRIKGMIETGGVDVMEIEFGEKEYLVPFSLNWIDDISPKKGQLALKKGTLEFFDVH